MTWYWGLLLVIVGFAMGTALTRYLMRPQYCPRCGELMRRRGRGVEDWLRKKREGVPGKGSPERNVKKDSGESNREDRN
jgi:hypothetical protein